MWREVARFEAQLQQREFLTWVYLAVFFLLTFGYTSSGAVELVTGRGTLPKNAPWALALEARLSAVVGQGVFEFGTMMCFAVPGTVIGISYILAYNVPPIELTGTGLILILSLIHISEPTRPY